MSNLLGHLLERNLLEVFGQGDSERRKLAISEVYTEDCTFFEAEERTGGRDALNAKIESILQGSPGFVFRPTSPAQVNHDHGYLQWQFGPIGAAPVVTGADVAVFEQGKIRALYVFFDEPPSELTPKHEGNKSHP